MGRLELRGVAKAFGPTRALTGVDLEVAPGEILGLTGPSGAGKSTLCRIVAGLESPSAGQVLLGDEPVTAMPSERRRVALMFESYALYPHLTIFENVAFPLRAPWAPPCPRAEAAARVRELLQLVELEGLEARRPAELSGGQRQRVALCRALVQAPRAWLLDEPISHLDAKLRHVLRGAIRRRLGRTDVPTIWTSPDAGEALAIADRMAVLIDGRVAQLGPPAEIYRWPATVDVARLVGDPPLNLLAGALEERGGTLRFRHPAFAMPLPARLRPRLAASRGAAVVLGLRPAEIGTNDDESSGPRGEVWVWEPFGKYGIVSVRLGPDVVRVKMPPARPREPGQLVTLDLTGVEPIVFDAATGAAL